MSKIKYITPVPCDSFGLEQSCSSCGEIHLKAESPLERIEDIFDRDNSTLVCPLSRIPDKQYT